jgi:LPXTG-motif cell wall-anchored protein
MLYKIIRSIIIFVIFLGVNSDFKVLADEIEIITIPEGEFLFDISNMKPGDWGQRSLIVKNGGTQDFNYSINVKNKSKDNRLFNELELEIYSKNTNILFKDKLKNFSGFTPKLLKKGEGEDLLFIIKMPFELGNEFQATSSHFEIQIIAEGKSASSIPQTDSNNNENPTSPVLSQGLSLPNTGTNLYTILLIGAILSTTGIIFIAFNRLITRKKES